MGLDRRPVTIRAYRETLRRVILREGISEVARQVGVTRKTVYGWIDRRKVVLPRPPHAARLDELIESRTTEP